MNKGYDILIAGGDMRQIYCAGRLAGSCSVSLTGFDDRFVPVDMKNSFSDKQCMEGYDIAVLPVMPLNENGMLLTPCSTAVISPESIRDMLKKDGIVFVGKANDKLRSVFRDFEICEYLPREELSLKNAVPTAEGAVQIALEELPVTLNGLRVLIVGLGRIGTSLAAILKGFGADVTAAVRNERGAAKARIAGVKHICSDSIEGGFGLVFNTVPELIFDRRLLSRFGDDTLFIDLASKPGGIDFEAASELGIKAVWALGLPGKTAPVTAGEIIAETVETMLAERGI